MDWNWLDWVAVAALGGIVGGQRVDLALQG